MTNYPLNPTLADVINLQRELGLSDVHVAHISISGFHLAHTDAERLSEMNLSECDLHRHLCDEGWNIRPGWYAFDVPKKEMTPLHVLYSRTSEYRPDSQLPRMAETDLPADKRIPETECNDGT
jgi:hypothetical protein